MAEATTKHPEPERELVRRALPFGLPAIAVAMAIGILAGGADAGWSAAIGASVVFANLAANGFLLSWAAGISLQALYVAAMGGFVLRMGVITALLFLLDRLAGFFSPLAFLMAVIPATILLLAYEMKLLASGVGAELAVDTPHERSGS
jgi:hypothetical protein